MAKPNCLEFGWHFFWNVPTEFGSWGTSTTVLSLSSHLSFIGILGHRAAPSRHGPEDVGPARHVVPPVPCHCGPRALPSAQTRACWPKSVPCRPARHDQITRPCQPKAHERGKGRAGGRAPREAAAAAGALAWRWGRAVTPRAGGRRLRALEP